MGDATTRCLKRKKWRLPERPGQTPDLDPVEMLWRDLERAVGTGQPKNMAELKQFCEEQWSGNPPGRRAGPICNYTKRVVEVISAKGGSAAY